MGVLAVSRRVCIEGTLAFTLTAGFFAAIWLLVSREVPEGSKEVLFVMLGSLGTAWTNAMAYYFGSSAGSAQKTALLGKTGAQSGTQGS